MRSMASRQAPTSQAPAAPDPFVGRSRELSALDAVMRGEAHRLVTVIGPPGVGKTRLLVEWARQAGALTVVDVSRARDAEEVAVAAASALGIDLKRATDAIARVGAALATEPRAVILDNFEQVAMHASATLGHWLRAAPGARFVVSSREALRIEGERRFELAPLSPRDAARLFVLRAEAIGVAIGDEQREAVLEITEQLDCIPLAIELAAGRTPVLSLSEIQDQLQRGRAVLRSRRRDVDPRHATMEATFDWSWRLLPDWAQAALAQLSVFAGSFGRADALAVLDLSAFAEAPDTLDVLESLQERSLLVSESAEQGVGRRFRLLVSIRDLALPRLADSFAVELRHARHVIDLLDETRVRVELKDRIRYRDEILLAFDRMQGAAPLEAARLMLAFGPLLVQEERYAAHEEMVARAVDCAQRGGSPELEIACRARQALIYAVTGHSARARAVLEPIVARVRQTPQEFSAELRSSALAHFGAVCWSEGRLADAQGAWAEALPLATGDSATSIASNLALVRTERGDLEAAERSLRALLDADEHPSLAQARFVLGHVRCMQGDLAEAATLLERVSADAPASSRVAHASLLRGAIEIHQARPESARRWLERAVEFDRDSGGVLASGVEGLLALSSCRQGDPVRAAEHLERAREAARGIQGRSWEAQIARALSRRVDDLTFTALGSPARLGPRSDEVPVDRLFILDLALIALFGEPATSAPSEGIWVARDGSWIQVGAAQPARLSRTPLLQRLLAALAEHRLQGHTTPVSVDALVQHGWPDERILPAAASNRLHQAVKRLRRLGLEEAMTQADGGYRLGPEVRVAEGEPGA